MFNIKWPAVFVMCVLCVFGMQGSTLLAGAQQDEVQSKLADQAAMVIPAAVVGPNAGNSQIWTVPQKNNADRIDALKLKDMDINDVFKLLSERSGLNIISGKNVQGRVTIFLRDVPVREALMMILRSNDLAYHEHGGVLEIMPAQEYEQKFGLKFGITTKTEVFSVVYAKAEDIFNIISPLLTSGVGHIEYDARSNKLVVTDTQEKVEVIRSVIASVDHGGLETKTEVFNINYAAAEDVMKAITSMATKDLGHVGFDKISNKVIATDVASKIEAMRRVVKSIDRKDKEVLIEARIVQIVLKDGFQMGVDWEAILSNNGKTRGKTTNNFLLLDPLKTPQSLTTIGTLGPNDYQVALSLLSTMGDTRLLSSPRIAVVNNQEAKIHVGSTKPYITTSQAQSTTAVTTAETVNLIDVGVKLTVVPTIHDDGYVTMKIHPEISSQIGKVTTSQNNEIPVIESSQVDTTISVKDGVTIIIGGLIKDELLKEKNKIPFLGDVPVLGRAFRSDSNSVEKTEIVIFLTPHIMNGDVPVDPETYMTIKRDKKY